MKVLMLAQRFHPHLGGVEKHLWELLGELAERGHRLTLVTERYDAALPERETVRLRTGEVEVVRIAAADQAGSGAISRKTCWPSMLGLRALVRQADLVHCHDFHVFLYWYLPLRLLWPAKKVCITFHGWEGSCPPTRRALVLRKLTEKLTAGNICIGEFICKWYGTRPDFISYGGVLPATVPATGEGEGAVFVGRLAPDTGVMIYLEALLLLRRHGVELHLTICGDGPLRQECERFAAENALPIRFLGFVSDPQPYVAAASLVFVASYLAILEAMSLRKVVFSVFDNPLKEDYLRLIPESSQRMFIAGSAQELAGQLEQAIADRSRTELMVQGAYQWACSSGWGSVADLYEQLWNAARRGRRPSGTEHGNKGGVSR